MQINGSFDVSQEKTLGASTVTNGLFICDGWRLNVAGAPVVSAQLGSTTIVPGLTNQLYITVSTAAASLAAGDFVGIYQIMEGYRVARLAFGMASAQPITIGFWSGHHRTGLYSGCVRNGAQNRSYAFTYTQNVADVMQYNTVTIPGDTAGTWAANNTAGLNIVFAMAAGATYTAPSANSWVAGVFIAAPGQVNGVAATSDVFRIEGVVVLPGVEGPSAARAPLIMRPFSEELILCQRHWESSYDHGVAAPSATTVGVFILPSNGVGLSLNLTFNFKTPKRALPTVNTYSPVTAAGGVVRDAGTNADVAVTTFSAGTRSFSFFGTSVATNSNWQMHYIADARL
jgi:hypothetical protein